jgi:putative aldouronate transport system substrate-binding protein
VIILKNRAITLVSIGAIVSMLSAMNAGCSPKDTSKDNSASAPTLEKASKPNEIKLFIDTLLSKENGQDLWAEEFQKKTGIKLNINQPVHNQYNEKLDLAFASGNIPDVVQTDSHQYIKYVKEDALLDISDFTDNSSVAKKMNPKSLAALKINDKLYAMPYENGSGPITYVRRDWLNKLNLNIPTNYGEFYSMLKSFKTLGDDVIPFTSPGLSNQSYLREFYQDAYPDFVKIGDTWVDGFNEPQIRYALERLRNAYVDGLIDSQVVTNKTSSVREKWFTGRVGTLNYWAGNWGSMMDDKLNAGPTGEATEAYPIPAIKETKYLIKTPDSLSITKKANNPAGIFKYLLEYMNDGGEGSILFAHGVEDVHWEHRDGKIVHRPNLSNNDNLFDTPLIIESLALNPISKSDFNYITDKRVTKSLEILDNSGIHEDLMPVSKTLNKINADLIALREQILAKVVLGSISIEEGLETYKKEAANLGVDQVVAELNAKN